MTSILTPHSTDLYCGLGVTSASSVARLSRARSSAAALMVSDLVWWRPSTEPGPVFTSASKRSIRRFVITEKAPTRAFSWLKAPTTFTFKTVLRHYAKQALTPQ